MKKPCFSTKMLQRSPSLKIFNWCFANLELRLIVINKTRDSVEKAKESRTHFPPYDAATPSLVPGIVAIKSATDFAVSDVRSTCSRVMGGKGAL
jgi:hypothetical protein